MAKSRKGKNKEKGGEIVDVALIARFIGYGFITLGLVFAAFGLLAIFKFKNFYPRLLASSKIDTVAMMTILIGLIFVNGINFFSLRLVFLMAIVLLLNPLIAHLMSRDAYLSGHRLGTYGEDLPEDKIKAIDDGSLYNIDSAESEDKYFDKDIYDIHE